MSQKRLPPAKPGRKKASPVEQVIVATLGGGQKPLTSAEIREVMRAKLEAILPALESAVRRGQVDVMDYVNFLAKYGLGEKASAPVRAKNAVVMLPPRNNFATPSQQNSQEIAVVEVVSRA